MKIVCVAGGSYKSFYLNYVINLQKCDLLIFNFGILYDYDIYDELMGKGIVTKELMNLSRRLDTQIVAGIFVKYKNKIEKSIIICNKDKIELNQISLGAKIIVKNKTFVIGDESTKTKSNNKIILSSKRLYPNLEHCALNKFYVFLDKFGVTFIEKRKMTRKFNKYSKFVLK